MVENPLDAGPAAGVEPDGEDDLLGSGFTGQL